MYVYMYVYMYVCMYVCMHMPSVCDQGDVVGETRIHGYVCCVSMYVTTRMAVVCLLCMCPLCVIMTMLCVRDELR